MRVGADYQLHTQRSTQEGKRPEWQKLAVWQAFAAQDHYRKLLWLDADALPMPSLEDVFERDGFWAEPDQGIMQIDERFNAFLSRLGDPPASGPYYNSGVFLVDLATARTMAPWMKVPPFEERFYDQNVLNRALLRTGVQAQRFSENARYNWMAPQFPDAARQCKIIHFSGDAKGLVGQFTGARP